MTAEAPPRLGTERWAPHRSLHEIPFANGLVSSKWNLRAHALDSFRERIYLQRDERTPTRDVLEALAYVGARPAPRPDSSEAAYEAGTGIVRYAARAGGRPFEAFVFAPMTEATRRLYYLVRAHAVLGPTAAFEAKVRLGPGAAYSACDGRATARHPAGDRIVVEALADAGAPRLRWEGDFLRVEGIGAGARWVGLAVTFLDASEEGVPPPAGLTPGALLDRERAWWRDWHAIERRPRLRTADEERVFLQSTAVLKMAQCREGGRSHGQILASLPPGHWNICWVRDAAYAVRGLIESNHLDEARAALAFFLNAECGRYVTFEAGGRDHGVGVPYKISVCRYYGDGTEESDGGTDPNIELDGFGLFLWVLDEYVRASGDEALLRAHARDVLDLTADALLHNIEPGLDVIRPESGPWERHLLDAADGIQGARRFAYTSAAAHRGLVAAAGFAEILGEATRAEGYRRAAERLRAGFARAFVTDGPDGAYVRGLHEETDPARCQDAAAVEAVNFGLVDAAVGRATLAAFDRHLKRPPTPGYMRNDDGSAYDRAEWVVIDLRIASASYRLGERDRADRLLDWVTAQSAANHGLIAELYDVDSADYAGAVPMCGFGPGAYLLALFDRDHR